MASGLHIGASRRSRCMSNNFESLKMSESLFSESTKKPNDFSSARVQELNDLKQFFKIQQSTYVKYKLLADALQEFVWEPSRVDNDLQAKVQDVIFEHSCEQLVDLEAESCNRDASKLLGLDFTVKSELSHEDSVKLNKIVDVQLQTKYKNVCEQFLKMAGESILKLPPSNDVSSLSLNCEDEFLLEMVRKVDGEKRKYVQNQLQLMKTLESISRLRLKKLPEACDEKLRECQIKSHMSEVQMKIVREKMRINVFMGSNNSLAAYQELIKDIKKQQLECELEVNHLKNLKEKHAQVACKQYDDILKEYIQYKMSLEKKKMILESLQR